MPRLEALEEPLQRSRCAGALVGDRVRQAAKAATSAYIALRVEIDHTLIRFTAS